MYLFEAHYINMVNDEEISKKIEFDEQFFETEKEIYLYAMSKAYDIRDEHELISSLEFISC